MRNPFVLAIVASIALHGVVAVILGWMPWQLEVGPAVEPLVVTIVAPAEQEPERQQSDDERAAAEQPPLPSRTSHTRSPETRNKKQNTGHQEWVSESDEDSILDVDTIANSDSEPESDSDSEPESDSDSEPDLKPGTDSGSPALLDSREMARMATHRPNPRYPRAAQAAGITGSVTLLVCTGAGGRVTKVEIADSNPLFDTAAATAIRKWKYRPHMVGGKPVPYCGRVRFDFVFDQ